MGRYIGIDLHRNCFTSCILAGNGRSYLRDWYMDELEVFCSKLKKSDEVAVEVTGNTRLFYDAVLPKVSRVVVVNPHQFKVSVIRSTRPIRTMRADLHGFCQRVFYRRSG